MLTDGRVSSAAGLTAIFQELKDVQSSSQIITTNQPTLSLLQARCPSCPTNSIRAQKEKCDIPRTCSVQARLSLPTWSLPAIYLLVTLDEVLSSL